MMRIPDTDGLAAHLESTYGVGVLRCSALDQGVIKVDLEDAAPWVARVFSPDRPPGGAAGDAAILRRLEAAGAHAERVAHSDPVSDLNGQQVLVTAFLEDHGPLKPGRPAGLLAAILGRLHTNPGEDLRPGGAWHHLSFVGGPTEEIAAAEELLDAYVEETSLRDLPLLDRLRDHVERTDGCADLPHAFVHPDCVPSNTVSTADDHLVIVDWTGAGRGPRLWSFAFLLWAAGAASARLIDVVVTYYRRSIELTPEELDRLAGAIRGRPVMLETWAVCAGRRALPDALTRIDEIETRSAQIAEQARRAFMRPRPPGAAPAG